MPERSSLRSLLTTVVLVAALAWAPAARAECTQPYPGDQLVNDLQVLQLSMRNLDETTFASTGKRLDTGIACLTSAAPSPVFASAYRYIGAWQFLVKPPRIDNKPQLGVWVRIHFGFKARAIDEGTAPSD
jgi:hypothetical protein